MASVAFMSHGFGARPTRAQKGPGPSSSGTVMASQLLSLKRPRPSQAAETSASLTLHEKPPMPEIHVHVTTSAFSAFGLPPHLCGVPGPQKSWSPLPAITPALHGHKGPMFMPHGGLIAQQPPRPRVVPKTKAEWIEVDDECDLVQHGFPSMAPALEFDEGWNDLFSSASYILYELAGEAISSMTLTHDWEWNEYPYIGQALRQINTVELPYALATINLGPNKKKWAVGLASNGKLRQKVVKLSLAVALAADAMTLQDTMRNHPGFKDLCEASGIFTGDVSNPPPDALMVCSQPWTGGSKKRRRGPSALPPPPPPLALEDGEVSPRAAPATPKLKPMDYKTQLCSDFQTEFACARGDACHFAHGSEELRKPGEVKPEDFKEDDVASLGTSSTTPSIALGRDELFWIELDTSEEVPKTLEGLPMEAVVLSTCNGKGRGVLNSADGVLQHVLGDEVKELKFIDDADWKELPAVGTALQKAMDKEECFTAVICPTRSIWAVGVGMRGKSRWTAAKLALVLAVALQQEEILNETPDFAEFPMVADMVKQAGEAKKLLN
ncbi:C3H1-type domain-containing protein [Durusdinium trenchii]|uniref:C3H1-type domain-containing protein n=1 Tax=Durusdinium trenchii TaxID=1381693 RepID=A0ABP0RTS5_9DINO